MPLEAEAQGHKPTCCPLIPSIPPESQYLTSKLQGHQAADLTQAEFRVFLAPDLSSWPPSPFTHSKLMAFRTQWNQDTNFPKALHRSQSVIISFVVHSSARRPEAVTYTLRNGYRHR